MNFFIGSTLANQLGNNKDTAVINNVDTLYQYILGAVAVKPDIKTVKVLLQ